MAHFYLWSARVHRHYGIVYADPNEFVSAVDTYRRALELNPRLSIALLERGILLWRELNHASHAVRDLTAALAVRPNWPAALFNRALAYQAAGDYRAAMADFSAYLALPDQNWRNEATHQHMMIRALFDSQANEEGDSDDA